jgi:phosphatidylglycerophosphate synthase
VASVMTRQAGDAPVPDADRASLQGSPRPRTGPALALGAVFLVALAGACAALAELSPFTVAVAGVLYGAIAAVILARIGAYHPHSRFGPANGITLLRAAINCTLAGMLVDLERIAAPDAGIGLVFVGLALFSLALDGFDGYLARRFRVQSRFGARFDVEVDGLLLALLAVAAYRLDKAGAWVLLIGATYYLFLAARRALPWLDGPLAPSFRRKAVCVIQGASLIVLMLPSVVPPASQLVALGALAALSYSFGVDVWALWRARLSDGAGARAERGPAGSRPGSSGRTGSQSRGRATRRRRPAETEPPPRPRERPSRRSRRG